MSRKRIILLIVLSGILVAGFLIVRSLVFNRLKSILQREIQTLNESNLRITYDSIHVNWRKNLIRIDSVNIERDSSVSQCDVKEHLSAASLELEGLSLFSILFNRELKFDRVLISHPHVVLAKQSGLLGGKGSKSEKDFSIGIDEVVINAAEFQLTDTSGCILENKVNTTLKILNLLVKSSPGNDLTIESDLLEADTTIVFLPKEFYTLSFRRARVNFHSHTAQIDTIRIYPTYSKYEFTRKKGHETDRVEGAIPYVKLFGFTLHTNDTIMLRSKKADIQMFLKFFRDKRLPFQKKYKLLPTQMLRTLPFGLDIDTFQITKSYISYEEIPEKAETSGTIFFDDLNAKILEINNDKTLKKGHTIINARARFMGDGKIEMHSVLPWNEHSKSLMKGSLRDFSFEKLNSVLMPAANLQVQSGHLTSLTFDYTYDNVRADGSIELNYNNLKLTTFKTTSGSSTDDEETKRDGLKSFILNAFIIRKNMDSNVPEDKRTGTVMFERDVHRSVFNFWWKSVFSGIKSAYNLDRLEQAKKKSEEKNEERKRRKNKR